MRRSRRFLLPGVLGLLLAVFASVGARGGDEGDELGRIRRLESARAQLDFARRHKLAFRRAVEEERGFLRTRAVEAYRAVRVYHPEEPATCAEAAFRAGEILRAAGSFDEALAEFAWARARGVGPFRVRAQLEIGHIQRRVGRPSEALDAYLAVVADANASAGLRDEALLWAGRVRADEGRNDDARRMWERVAEAGEDPVDRIRAYDYLALLWVVAGDPEAAAGVLDRCRRALSDVALEETKRGERVRKALVRMRVVEALQRAVENRIGE